MSHLSPAASGTSATFRQSERPVVAVVLLAQGHPAKLEAAMARLVPLCAEHAARLVVVWPGENAPSVTDRRGELLEVVLVSPAMPKIAARQAGAARAQADLIMFTDDAQAVQAGWADIVAFRVGFRRRGSNHALGDNWASILREQGVPDSAHGG